MRIMTYNIHSCLGLDGRRSHERIATVIERYEPDVVALQEIDRGRPRSAHLDQTRAIADLVEMDAHFHPALRVAKEEYGDAILSRHPLNVVQTGALPQPRRTLINEPRGAIWVEVETPAGKIQFINTHFGLGRRERRKQAAALLGSEWIEAAAQRGPLVVCGDFNSPAGRVVHTRMTQRLRDAQTSCNSWRRWNTFPTVLPVLCIDHIFITEHFDVAHCETPRTPLTRISSDHFPLIAHLSLRKGDGNGA